jgi:hypothetical protein
MDRSRHRKRAIPRLFTAEVRTIDLAYRLAALCVALFFRFYPGGFTRTRLGHLLFHAGEQRFVGYFLDFVLAIQRCPPTSEARS